MKNPHETEGRRENPYFDIPILGKFGKGKILVKQSPQEQYSEGQEAAIEKVWQARNEARLAAGQKPLESASLNLKRAIVENDRLVIEVAEGTYKDHIAIQDRDFRNAFPDFDPRTIGTNIVVRTNDSKLMIIQRSMDSATKPGALSVVGGQGDIGKDCDEDGIWDPFKTIARELEEEAGIKKDEVNNLVAAGIIYNKTIRNPSIIFYADSSLSSDQIRQRVGDGEVWVKFIAGDQADLEHSILWWTSSPSPSGSAALAIYGKDKFGIGWLNKINNRIEERNVRLYSKLFPDQLKSIDQKAFRMLSRKD